MNNLLKLSLFQTVRFNFHYFGLKGIIHPKVLLSKNVKIVNLSGSVIATSSKIGAVKIGFGEVGIIDNKYERVLWENKGCVKFKGNVFLGIGTKIACSGELIFEDGSRINANSAIVCKKSIYFGKNSLVSWDCLIMDTDFHSIYKLSDETLQKKIINEDKEIIIGDKVWIGCRSTILKGTFIPSGGIIAAGSIVTKKLEDNNCIYVSNDKINEGITWK